MKKNIMYGFLLFVAIVLFTACGTDNKENPPQPDGPYSFFNASTPVVVTPPITDVNGTVLGADYNLSVQLLEYDLVKSGETIQMKSFPMQYGFVTNQIVLTDENGRATFIYNAPTGNDYNAIRGQDITIQAVYLDATSTSTTPDILLTQDFVLQFR